MSTLKEVQTSIENQISKDLMHVVLRGDMFEYAVVGLSEEVGEVAGLRKRILRNSRPKDAEGIDRNRWVEELGDVLWYLAATCASVGINLEEVWKYNQRKVEKEYGRDK